MSYIMFQSQTIIKMHKKKHNDKFSQGTPHLIRDQNVDSASTNLNGITKKS